MDKTEREAQLEAAKTLATAIGVRKAARQLGIPEPTMQAWSARYNWFKQPELPPTITNPRQATIATTTPSEALKSVLTENSGKIKLSLSKAAVAASRSLEGMSGSRVLKQSRPMKDIAGTASLVHGWEEKKQDGGSLRVNILANQAAVQIQQQE